MNLCCINRNIRYIDAGNTATPGAACSRSCRRSASGRPRRASIPTTRRTSSPWATAATSTTSASHHLSLQRLTRVVSEATGSTTGSTAASVSPLPRTLRCVVTGFHRTTVVPSSMLVMFRMPMWANIMVGPVPVVGTIRTIPNINDLQLGLRLVIPPAAPPKEPLHIRPPTVVAWRHRGLNQAKSGRALGSPPEVGLRAVSSRLRALSPYV